MKEFFRKPYLSKSYKEMMTKTSNAAIWEQIKSKHSEFEKPYQFSAGEYAEMQHYYPNLPGLSFSDLKFDHPWMNEQVPDVRAMKGIGTVSFPGCEFEFPGLFSKIAKCEIKCEVLDDRSRWSDGTPRDPIISWEAKNGVITESDMYHACVKANEDAPYGQWVELIATTKSGETCRGFAWVEGNDCCSCTGISIGYTTQQMAVDEVQTLTVTGAVEGCTYNWAISSGGGSLSAATGTSVDYTAPSTNAECANNPTITLSVEGAQCDVLQIAVNAGTGVAVDTFNAWEYGELGDCYCACYYDQRNCADAIVSLKEMRYEAGCCGPPSCCDTETMVSCAEDEAYCKSKYPYDRRTVAQKTAGCCPASLL